MIILSPTSTINKFYKNQMEILKNNNGIKELEILLEKAELIEKRDTDKVGLGTTVKIKYVEDGDIEEFTIVGSKEADPSNNKISNESPIAQAIMGAKVGETKTVNSPGGSYDVKIKKIA